MPTLLLAHNTPDTIRAAITAHGFFSVTFPPAAGMATPVASHPDMLLFAGFGRLFVRDTHLQSADFAAAIDAVIERTSLLLTPTSDSPSATYPHDVAFNFLHLPSVALVGKADYISGALGRAATAAMLPVVDTRQGYAKCSSALIADTSSIKSELAVITADPSIHRTVVECGVRTVKIAPGHVTLPDYDTGFIGGASFYYDKTLYFLGNIDSHPDAGIIRNVADELGINITSLSDEPLFDAGCLLLE